MRLNSRSIASETLRIIRVLASPGTPTSNAWPPARSAIRISSITVSCPTILFPASARRRVAAASRSSRDERCGFAETDCSAIELWGGGEAESVSEEGKTNRLRGGGPLPIIGLQVQRDP